MPVTVEDLKNPEKKFSIKVNETKTDCDVNPNGIQRKAINGEMITLYTCTLQNEIKDTSGFWIHKDCLEGDKIRENTFDVSDIRKSLNGKRIVSQENGGDYVRVTVDEGVSRKEFLRKIEDIYLREVGETEQQPAQLPAPVSSSVSPLPPKKSAPGESSLFGFMSSSKNTFDYFSVPIEKGEE